MSSHSLLFATTNSGLVQELTGAATNELLELVSSWGASFSLDLFSWNIDACPCITCRPADLPGSVALVYRLQPLAQGRFPLVLIMHPVR